MATRLQLRKGTKIQNDIFTGAEAELTYDSTSKGLRIHDGSKQGGYLVDVVVDWQAPTAENNYTWYRKYSSGWIEQGGTMPYANVEEIKTIVLPIEMSNSDYTLQLTRKDGSSSDTDTSYSRQQYHSKSTTGFSFWWSTNSRQSGIDWQVSGMAA